MLKIVDRFLIKSFVPPFVVSFFIALFVLIMQFLWKNIAHLIGKGLSMWTIMEVISYMSISLMPMALPIAVLLSSVLVFGGAAERFEMASLKSAGVSFGRMSMSVMIFCFGVSLFSFFCSNNIIPVTNLKFHTRMYDIKKAKPTLSLEEGLFNDDFQNFVIYVGEKDVDNERIRDVIIYDQSRQSSGLYNALMAEDGRMYITPDERYFVMELYDGERYEELKPDYKRGSKYGFTRAEFKKWTKIFDLKEFDMGSTDEDLFAHHRYMLTTKQILDDTDTLVAKIAEIDEDIRPNLGERSPVTDLKQQDKKLEKIQNVKAKLTSDKEIAMAEIKPTSKTKSIYYEQDPDSVKTGKRFLNSFDDEDHVAIHKKAMASCENYHNRLRVNAAKRYRNRENIAKNGFEIHSKFAWAAMCMIFLLIGGPMGAIVRKGGYGVSLLVAIIFFVLFIISSIFFRKLCHELVMHPVAAAWMAPVILFALGIFLTIKASNDSNVLTRPRWLERLWRKMRSR